MNNSERLYQEMLNTSLQRLVEEINLLEQQRGTLSSMVKGTDEKIERLRVEASRIQEELNSRKNESQYGGNAIGTVDAAMTVLTTKQQELSDRLKRLQELRKITTTKRGTRKLNRAIFKAYKRNLRMKKIVTVANQIQRVMIMPSQTLVKWRIKNDSKVQGGYNYTERKLQEYDQKGALSILEGINRARMIRKRDKTLEKLRKLQRKEATNTILGARQTQIKKTQAQNLQSQNQPAVQAQQSFLAPMPPRNDTITASTLANETLATPTQQVSQTLKKAA